MTATRKQCIRCGTMRTKVCYIAAMCLGIIVTTNFMLTTDLHRKANIKDKTLRKHMMKAVSGGIRIENITLQPSHDPLEPKPVEDEDFYEHMLLKVMSNHLVRDQTCNIKKSKPNCSFPSIAAYMTECGYFPSQLNVSSDGTLVAGNCEIPHVTKETVLNYLHEQIDRIVTMGDSQAGLYFGALVGELSYMGVQCVAVKSEPEGFQAKKSYFFEDTDVTDALLDTNRTCRTCNSFLRKCQVPGTEQYPQNKTLYLENMSLIMNIDATMVNRTYCNEHPDTEVCKYSSYSEVMFKYYLKDKYPDVLIVFTSFAHDVRVPLQKIVPKLEPLANLISESLPSKSHVIWVPATLYNFKRFPDSYDMPGLGFNTRIQMLNHWLYHIVNQTIEKDVGPRSHGFFDVSELGQIQEMPWAFDYIHFGHVFYNHIGSTLIKLLPSL